MKGNISSVRVESKSSLESGGKLGTGLGIRSLVFRANERFTQKNERFTHCLIFGERLEQFAHDCSFPMSDSLTSPIFVEQHERFYHIAH